MKRGLDLRPAHAARQRAAAAGGPGEEQSCGAGGGARGELACDLDSSGLAHAVEDAEVPEQAERGAEVGAGETLEVGLAKVDLDVRRPRRAARRPQRAADEVDAGDLPAAPRQDDRPVPAAAAELERAAERPVPPVLLGREEERDLPHRRRIRRHALPGKEAERVGEAVGEIHAPGARRSRRVSPPGRTGIP